MSRGDSSHNSNAQLQPVEQEDTPPRPKRTPLPLSQLLIVYLIQFTEPLTASVIYPFLNQFVRDTGVIDGDERKTGYYAGVIGSVFFVAEGLTVFQWGSASDRFGRRPVLLLGPIGLALAMLGFGLSSKFWTMVVSRFIQGVFNGNIGVSKSIIVEITDSTNIADAYAFMPMTWSLGTTIGPIIGGVLSEPAKRWPLVFGQWKFFHDYPYFLPCAVAGLIAVVSAAMAYISLKETAPVAMAREREKRRKTTEAVKIGPNSTTPLLDQDCVVEYGSRMDLEGDDPHSSDDAASLDAKDMAPSPFKALLIPQVILPVTVYALQSFIDMCSQFLLPLMYSTSIPVGGLGFDPYQIGTILSAWGVVNAVILLTVLGPLLRRFGVRTVYLCSYVTYFINLSSYPLLSYFARRAGFVDWKAWCVIILQLITRFMNAMSYGAMQVIIAESAPSRSALGATNGLAQAMASFGRAIAPTVASSLFSVSLERQLLGGNMVYVILTGMIITTLPLGLMLPEDTRQR